MTDLLFSDLGLSEAVLSAVSERGFTAATAIQSQAIPFLLQGRDGIVEAQPGPGKTVAIAITAIQTIATETQPVKTPALCPTRHIDMPVADEFQKLLGH